jgi:hypothetical protein
MAAWWLTPKREAVLASPSRVGKEWAIAAAVGLVMAIALLNPIG